MKLYELKLGQRFEFESRHRNHIFKVTDKTNNSLTYIDQSTGETRRTTSIRKAWAMDVYLAEEGRIKETVTVEIAGSGSDIKVVAEIISNKWIPEDIKERLEQAIIEVLTN